ncbi:MAG: T9SS type A sorting domain-containing protein, partial [Ignavibacteriales bacterium]
LLYNVNLNGGLLPGDYNELLKVKYKVVDLPNISDNVKSSMKITNAAASTTQGQPINITPSRNELKIYARVPVVIPDYGLIFEQDTVHRLEDDSYTELLQLINSPAKIQALQFRLSVNKVINDNTILTFQSIRKSDDLLDPSWVLDYAIFRGPLTPNGASEDEILVLLYNLQQNNGLQPGTYKKLLEVTYRVADLPALEDSIKSSIKISDAEASTYQGFPINITPSRSELTIIARNRVGFYGDVNGDGCLDILDIIMIVDHIVGRDSLNEEQFQRADLAPWTHGNPAPFPDGFVNVQDLSLLQNIILSGRYPDGTIINGCSYTILPKTTGNSDVIGTFYINNEGITLYSNYSADIRGAQIEFDGVENNPEDMFITTELGQGYYQYSDGMLRALLYDRQGQKTLPAGENLLGDFPFFISRPEDIKIEKFILIDVNREKIVVDEVEIIFGNPPSIPLDYILYQNYPNPFNPSTTIEYSLPKKSDVMLKAYDILGTEVSSLVYEAQNRGNYSVTFNPVGLASGIYFYRLQADSFVQTKKMIL